MNNLDFFKACFSNELKATYDVLCALPSDKLDYKPHPVNRSAYEIAEHIVAHICDMDVILHQSICDEKISHHFDSPSALADEMKGLWEKALADLEQMTNEQWEKETVELIFNGMSLFTVPRMMMA